MEQLKTLQKAIEPESNLLNLLHKHIPYLRKQWIVFCEMVEKYGQHAENCMNEARLKINTKSEMSPIVCDKKMLKLRREYNEAVLKFNEASNKHDHKTVKRYDKLRQEKQDAMISLDSESRPQPPEPGCVRHYYGNFYYLNDPADHIYWITPKVVNPLLWFNFFGNAPIQRESTKQERVIIDCALLAVAHDQEPELRYSEEHIYRNKNYTGRYFKRNSFCQALYDNLDDGQIERAFDRIPELSKQATATDKTDNGGGEKPKHLMTSTTILDNFKVCRSTLKRKVKEGELIDYRSPTAASNAPLLLDAVAVAKLYPRLKVEKKTETGD